MAVDEWAPCSICGDWRAPEDLNIRVVDLGPLFRVWPGALVLQVRTCKIKPACELYELHYVESCVESIWSALPAQNGNGYNPVDWEVLWQKERKTLAWLKTQ